jgi:ferredoxin
MSRYCVTIDLGECIGYGRCADLAPEVFRIDGGSATLLVAETDDPQVVEAAAECPMSAITVEEVLAA